MKKRSHFTAEFKVEAASLVLEQGYNIREACGAVGACETAMRPWVKQLKQECEGLTPTGSQAMTVEHQRIPALEAKITRIEREKDILKKATALLMSDSMRS